MVGKKNLGLSRRHLIRNDRRNLQIFVRRVYHLILRLSTKEKFTYGRMGFIENVVVQGEFPYPHEVYFWICKCQFWVAGIPVI